jgi:hypothetical protein
MSLTTNALWVWLAAGIHAEGMVRLYDTEASAAATKRAAKFIISPVVHKKRKGDGKGSTAGKKAKK